MVAPAGSSSNVALLIEPRPRRTLERRAARGIAGVYGRYSSSCRPHHALEHVIRNAMLFLNGSANGAGGGGAAAAGPPAWQLQVTRERGARVISGQIGFYRVISAPLG